MRIILDLETNGLDPQKNVILEIGAILVDSDFEEVDRFHRVVWGLPSARERAPDVVRKMHDDNGLWAEIQSEVAVGLGEADIDFAEWLESHGATPGAVELVGRSVHFDLGFVRAELPLASKLITYRVLDVGAVLRLIQKAGVAVDIDLPYPDTVHRSMPDCENELTEAQAAYRWLQVAAQIEVVGSVK